MARRQRASLLGWMIAVVAVFVLYDIYQAAKRRLGITSRPNGGPPPTM